MKNELLALTQYMSLPVCNAEGLSMYINGAKYRLSEHYIIYNLNNVYYIDYISNSR